MIQPVNDQLPDADLPETFFNFPERISIFVQHTKKRGS